MQALVLVNFGFVLFFGIALTLSFADISLKNNVKQYGLIFLFFGLAQVFIFLAFGSEFLFKSYPFLTHLPLFLLLKYLYKKNTYIAAIAILSAYLFCTPRKWMGTLISSFWSYDNSISYHAQVLITIPLLIIIIRYISPYVARLKYEGDNILRLFISVPLIYYILEYSLTVYTDFLYRGGAAAIEFMDSAIVIIYFIFSIIFLKTLYEKKEIEVQQALFRVLAEQSRLEIEALRKSQEQAVIYRHDLKHHLNYLHACISENNFKGALSHISETCRDIDDTKITRYSENEPLNLILSSYLARAEEKKIPREIDITVSDLSKYSTLDLCSLLSNALENAIHACEKITDIDNSYIKLRMYTKNNKLCIDIRNSCQYEPVFEQGLPVSNEQGHGLGTKSMALVVEKYNGIYQFSAKDGNFIFQATI